MISRVVCVSLLGVRKRWMVRMVDVFAFAGKQIRGNVTWQERDPLTIW
jgi:hypothetical protein